jgi:hypothetical protein
MELTLIILTSVILVFQFILDFVIDYLKEKKKIHSTKTKKMKIIIGAIMLIIGICVIWFAYRKQKCDIKIADSSHKKEIKNLQSRFDTLDNHNIALKTELNIRNSDLQKIMHQNDSLRSQIYKLAYSQEKIYAITQTSSEETRKKNIEEAKKGTLLGTTGKNINYEFYNIIVGGNINEYSKTDLQSGFDIPSKLINCDGKIMPIRIKLVNNRILLSSKFYSFENEIVGEIINNNWQINANVFFKFNYDSNALEVIDNYDIVIIQIVIKDNNIRINGIIPCGNDILICSDENIYDLNKNLQKKDSYIEQGRKIQRIFEYTGEGWLGKRKK